MIKLPFAEWQSRKGLRHLIAVLTHGASTERAGGAGGAVRYVGGAVRDTLLGLAVSDIDLAVTLLPEEVIARLTEAGIKAVPTGLAHGTVTAVSDRIPYQVTTLRRDVSTDGRRAVVAFSTDWREDASRRDFTFNALYADPDTAEISDYFGGIADLRARRVRFVGDPAKRVAEDHLRIIRYYRFRARFGPAAFDAADAASCNDAALDAASRNAIVAARGALKSLSRERITDELLKLLALPNPCSTVIEMAEDGIFAVIMPEIADDFAAVLERLVRNEQICAAAADGLRRLAALLPADVRLTEGIAARLRLSKRARKRLAIMAARSKADMLCSPVQLAYRLDRDAARDRWLMQATSEQSCAAIEALAAWQRPAFPLKGGAIVARGIAAGPEVARLLRAVEEQWIAENFPDQKRVELLLNAAIDSPREGAA